MSDVNAWSIIVPGVVTPFVVAGFAFFQQHVARRAATTEELRSVVDAAAAAYASAHWLADRVARGWRDGASEDEAPFAEASAALRDVDIALYRLRIRVGFDADVASAYFNAEQALSEYLVNLKAAIADRRPFDEDQAEDWFGNVAFTRVNFVDAAKAAIGHGKSR
jgi:hypothetical protein